MYASTTQQTLVSLHRLSKWLPVLKAEMSFLMMGGGLTRGGGCIYTARNRTGWGKRWLLRGEAIYFLSGLEMSEKKITNAKQRRRCSWSWQRRDSHTLLPFFFFLIDISVPATLLTPWSAPASQVFKMTLECRLKVRVTAPSALPHHAWTTSLLSGCTIKAAK